MNQDQIINYIFSLQTPEYGFYLQNKFKQRTLMSSSFAIMTLELIDAINLINKEAHSAYLLSSQDSASGLFIDSNLNIDFKDILNLEKNYISFQSTAFSLSALDILGEKPKFSFNFLDTYRDKKFLEEWICSLNWSNPWHESNKIMFIMQFLSYENLCLNNKESKELIVFLLDILNNLIDRKTGLWGTDKGASLFSAIAAAFHFYIFYQYFKKEIPCSNLVLDYTVSHQELDGLFHPLGGGGACEDLDSIYIITQLAKDKKAVKSCLLNAYNSIINLQLQDGGFCWASRPNFPMNYGLKYLNIFSSSFHFGMFKWIVKKNILGTFIPIFKDGKQYSYSNWCMMKYNINESDSWSTWFRLLALAKIETIFPEFKDNDINFNFRPLPSLGY
tara:strand:+ start:1642 stop:2808 length:1167 start_codon:yes stop_codon:yes gene_type:complete